MSDEAAIRGSKLSSLGGKPKRNFNHRVCKEVGCDTILSSYNKGSKCYLHMPLKKFRIRGRTPSEIMDTESNVPQGCISCMNIIGIRYEKAFKVLLDGVVHVQGTKGKATVCEA